MPRGVVTVIAGPLSTAQHTTSPLSSLSLSLAILKDLGHSPYVHSSHSHRLSLRRPTVPESVPYAIGAYFIGYQIHGDILQSHTRVRY